MKKIIYMIVLLPVVFTSGCSSRSDYRRLTLEISQLKNESEKLQNDMAMFKKAYNPELQELFSENILAAQNYRKSIEKTNSDIENISIQINNILHESENDRMLISENLRTSTTENVVNEFRQLNKKWDATVFELSNMVRNSERAVQSTHQAAIQAAEKAGAAERSADYLTEYVNRINEQTRSLHDVHEKLKNIENRIRKINDRLDEMEDPKGHQGKERAVQKK
jgi:methyl-accepting chemotaxis protein